MNLSELKDVVVEALEEIKAIDVRVIEVSHLTDVADFLIIASGSSNRQVRALAENVLEKCREKGERPIGHEGKEQGEWILLDFGSIVVHVMQPDAREFYDLERLWDIAASGRTK